MILPLRPTVIVLLCVGLCLIVVGLIPFSARPPANLTSSYLVHPMLKVVNATGQPVNMAMITVFTLNPASHLASLAVASPTADLVQDLNFTTNDLVIGPTINSTAAIGPKDGDLVLTSMYTNQDGVAQFNITAGIFLINVDKPPAGYFNIITHLRTGWAETVKLKQYQSPQFESSGPYVVGAKPGFSSNSAIGIQPFLLFIGIFFATSALVLKFVMGRKTVESNRPIRASDRAEQLTR